MLTNIYMKKNYNRIFVLTILFVRTETENWFKPLLKIILMLVLYLLIKTYILTVKETEKRIPLWKVVVLTLLFYYCLRILELFKKKWNGLSKKISNKTSSYLNYCLLHGPYQYNWTKILAYLTARIGCGHTAGLPDGLFHSKLPSLLQTIWTGEHKSTKTHPHTQLKQFN